MKYAFYMSVALLGAAMGFGGHALAANSCQAGNLSCPTTMPVGGYCECKSGGNTQDGTVVGDKKAMSAAGQTRDNAVAGGCGAQPNAPGCR